MTQTPATTTVDTSSRRVRDFGRRALRNPGAIFAAIFVVLVVVLLISTPRFGTWGNISNILQQNSIIGIVACGMLLMIVVGGFDLSVGAVGATSSVVAATLIVSVSTEVGIAAALVVGIVVGIVNGFFISVVGMNAFVVTLGTQTLLTGLLFVATQASPVYGVPDWLTEVGLGRVGIIPNATIAFIVVGVTVWGVLRYTRFGHYIYAVGGNKDAARLAGVPVNRVIIATYAVGGLLAAVAGVLLLGQTGVGQPNSATAWPLAAIAAVVVGGVPLSGGVGRVSSVVMGTFLLGVVANALNLSGVSPYWQPAVTGAVILAAVGIDSYQRKRRALR